MEALKLRICIYIASLRIQTTCFALSRMDDLSTMPRLRRLMGEMGLFHS